MKYLKVIFLLSVFAALFACENEIELSGDFKETAVVYGIISAAEDTQFVRVNRTFLEEGQSAVNLAKDADRIYFENLDVRLIDIDRNDSIKLTPIEKPKQDGLFSNQENIVYFVDTTLEEGRNYKLEVIRPDGEVSTGTARALESANINNPADVRNQLGFFRASEPSRYLDVNFIFGYTENIAKLEAYVNFYYQEQVGNQRFDRSIKFPLGSITNNLERSAEETIILEGRKFYEQIAKLVPKNGNRKRVAQDDCISVEVFAADVDYAFYQNLNGPIESLAQVRPEFTNIENGLGLFASRSFQIQFAKLTNDTRAELFSGSITGEYNFTDP